MHFLNKSLFIIKTLNIDKQPSSVSTPRKFKLLERSYLVCCLLKWKYRVSASRSAYIYALQFVFLGSFFFCLLLGCPIFGAIAARCAARRRSRALVRILRICDSYVTNQSRGRSCARQLRRAKLNWAHCNKGRAAAAAAVGTMARPGHIYLKAFNRHLRRTFCPANDPRIAHWSCGWILCSCLLASTIFHMPFA